MRVTPEYTPEKNLSSVTSVSSATPPNQTSLCTRRNMTEIHPSRGKSTSAPSATSFMPARRLSADMSRGELQSISSSYSTEIKRKKYENVILHLENQADFIY